MISPLNSAGRAHVDEDQLGVAEARQDVVAEGPQRVVGLGQLVAGRVVRRHVGRQRQAVVQPVLATAVEDAHVVVAVQLELPVRPRGEPVVVVAVQDDRRVGADAARRQQRGEVLARGDVAADAVGQLARPVPADRRRAGGSARRRPCRRRPRRSGRSGRRGGPGPRSASTRAVSWLMVDGLPSWWAAIPVTPGRVGDGGKAAVAPSRSAAGRSVASAELGEPLGTVGRGALGLADDPGVDPARVLDGHGRPGRAVLEDDARAVAVVGHPVRLELDDDVGDDRDGEQPVEVGRVEPVGDVGEPLRAAALEPGERGRSTRSGRERVAALGDGRRRDGRVRQAGRGGPERAEPDRREGRARSRADDLRVVH